MATLTVIGGPMFAGKSEELLRRIKNADLAGLTIEAFRPVLDTRQDGIATWRMNSEGEFVVAEKYEPVTVVNSPEDIYTVVGAKEPNMIIFDEAQFYPDWIVDVVKNLIFERLRKFGVLPQEVVVAGLDMWADGTPAGQMPNLLAMADVAIKIRGTCYLCKKPKKPSVMTYKERAGEGQVEVGGFKIYKPACRGCWRPPKK